MAKHRGAPLFILKRALMDEYREWCETGGREYTKHKNEKDMIEFLIQKDFLKGKKFQEYCDNIELPMIIIRDEFLREGYLIPDCWIGRRNR